MMFRAYAVPCYTVLPSNVSQEAGPHSYSLHALPNSADGYRDAHHPQNSGIDDP